MWYDIFMKSSAPKQSETKSAQVAQPIEPSGTVKVAGEKVFISTQTVYSKPGSSSKTLLKSLKEASKKSPFPLPAYDCS